MLINISTKTQLFVLFVLFVSDNTNTLLICEGKETINMFQGCKLTTRQKPEKVRESGLKPTKRAKNK